MNLLLLSLLLATTWAEQLPKGSEGEITSDVTGKARSGCEYPFQPVGNGCLFFSEDTRNFAGAQKACETLGHGYDVSLATFDIDENEDEAILMTAASKDKSFWVGASTEDGENWQWVDGRPVYLQAPILYHQEPNESQNKCMVAQVTVGGSNKRAYLFDNGCEESMNYICQIGCPYEFHLIGKYCYFFSAEEGISRAPTWQSARDSCEALSVPVGYHSDLAVLGLDDQDTYRLINIVSAYTYPDPYTWIGGTVENECDFKWIDGRTISSYSHYWYYNDPRCGSTYNVYLHYDAGLNRTYMRTSIGSAAFICQMFKD